MKEVLVAAIISGCCLAGLCVLVNGVNSDAKHQRQAYVDCLNKGDSNSSVREMICSPILDHHS